MGQVSKLAECEYNKIPLKDTIPENEDSPPSYGFGIRHIQLIIFMLCLTVSYIARGHMGVTIVAMTSAHNENITTSNISIPYQDNNETDILTTTLINNLTKDVSDYNISTYNDVTLRHINNTTKDIDHIYIYDWPKSIQEMVLSGFFFGYMLMMFPMGLVCQRYGGKLPLQIASFSNAILSCITPWLTIWGGWKAVCCCRILQGITQSGTYPCLQALLAKWAPVNERTGLTSCVHTGLTVGTVIGYQLAGVLGTSKWGWPSSFYAVGGICFACFLLLTFFGAANPLEHKSISEEERRYIMGPDDSSKCQTKLNTPWRAILTSRPLWATVVTHFACNSSFVFCLNQMPSYTHYVFGVNVRNSGLITSSPYIASLFTTLTYGWVSNYCINKKYVSTKNARRFCNTCAQVGLTSCLLVTSYTNSTTVAVTCLIMAIALNMGINCGCLLNYIDLAPNFSGVLMALGNAIANFGVILTTVAVSYIVTDMTDVSQWRIMFFIMFGICFACNTIFLIFVSTDAQPWNYGEMSDFCVEDAAEEMKKEKIKE